MTCRHVIRAAMGVALLLQSASPGLADAIPISALGSAANFAVLGATAVTNTGPTTLAGGLSGSAHLGLSPGLVTAITGLGEVTFPGGYGQVYQDLGVVGQPAYQAQLDASAAYSALSSLGVTGTLTGLNLGLYNDNAGGLGRLAPGVYAFESATEIAGELQLDAQGMDGAYWVFQIHASTLVTAASNSTVSFVNINPVGNRGADINVFWLVGTSATLGVDTAFAGNILAEASITLNHGAAILSGRALALAGAVTMDANTISVLPVPEPSTVGAFALGLAALCGCGRRRPMACSCPPRASARGTSETPHLPA